MAALSHEQSALVFQCAAALCLMALGGDERCREELAGRCAVIHPLLAALGHASPSVACHAGIALGSLVRGHRGHDPCSEQRRSVVAAAGSLPKLAAALEPRDAGAEGPAEALLQMLSGSNPADVAFRSRHAADPCPQ